MNISPRHERPRWLPTLPVWVAAATLLVVGCDTVEPEKGSTVVVEGFLDSGRPLPAMRLRQTLSPFMPYTDTVAALREAEVDLFLDGRRVRYREHRERAGMYVPLEDTLMPASPLSRFTFRARWRGGEATASGIIPHEIRIGDVRVVVPDKPVSAVLLDSLKLTDSLSVPVENGYIYPVEVTVWWNSGQISEVGDEEFWVRAQLEPRTSFSSAVVDLFLRSETIVRETAVAAKDGRRSWTGVYAVLVDDENEPLPEHTLRVALVRSSRDYARFVASRDAPERREPHSNVTGGIGIVAGISLDTLRVTITANPVSSN